MANMVFGYGPVYEGGPDVYQFYSNNTGFGSLAEVPLRRAKYDGMGAFALEATFHDLPRTPSVQLASGDGFMKVDDILGQPRGMEAFVDRALVRLLKQRPGLSSSHP